MMIKNVIYYKRFLTVFGDSLLSRENKKVY